MKKQLTGNSIADNQNKSNIETRFANRAKSIFASTGQIVNDFYLEIGIYCIGLFNASLVGWDIYTDLYNEGQPLIYAVLMGLIALIAVEGLAVYLVGAAAKTNNGWLWFFSVVFAGFFTIVHSYGSENISKYITWAVPFFVVIGYWGKVLKRETEEEEEERIRKERDEEKRLKEAEETKKEQSKIEQSRLEQDKAEEKARLQKVEDEERHQKMALEKLKLEQKHTEKLAQMEVQKEVSLKGQTLSDHNSTRLNPSIDTINDTKKLNADTRRKKVLDLLNNDMSYINIASELGVSLSTVKRDVKTLNGSVKK